MLVPAEKIKIRQLIPGCFSVVDIIKLWPHWVASLSEFVWLSEYELGLRSANLCSTEKGQNKYSQGWALLFCCGIESSLPWASFSIIDRSRYCFFGSILPFDSSFYWPLLLICVIWVNKEPKYVKSKKHLHLQAAINIIYCLCLFYMLARADSGTVLWWPGCIFILSCQMDSQAATPGH